MFTCSVAFTIFLGGATRAWYCEATPGLSAKSTPNPTHTIPQNTFRKFRKIVVDLLAALVIVWIVHYCGMVCVFLRKNTAK